MQTRHATRGSDEHLVPNPREVRSMVRFEGRSARGIHTKRRVDRARDQREIQIHNNDEMRSSSMTRDSPNVARTIYITNHRASVITVICPGSNGSISRGLISDQPSLVISSCDLIKRRSMKRARAFSYLSILNQSRSTRNTSKLSSEGRHVTSCAPRYA